MYLQLNQVIKSTVIKFACTSWQQKRRYSLDTNRINWNSHTNTCIGTLFYYRHWPISINNGYVGNKCTLTYGNYIVWLSPPYTRDWWSASRTCMIDVKVSMIPSMIRKKDENEAALQGYCNMLKLLMPCFIYRDSNRSIALDFTSNSAHCVTRERTLIRCN